MALDGKNIDKRTAEWEAQLAAIQLPRTLLGGTKAMRKAREAYLPRQKSEEPEDYNARLAGAVLLNQLKRTIGYLSGQVFQRPVKYQEPKEGQTVAYNQEFFTQFMEDVDTRGTNLTMFIEQVFADGVTDGVVFILTDYSRVDVERGDDGNLYYKGADGERRPKTAEADKAMGLRPYFVLVKAEQVLDAWFEIVDGKAVLKEFRYLETFEVPQNDGTRKSFSRVRMFTPGAWETWETSEGASEYTRSGSGSTSISVVPVDWFMPGEQQSGLTATPALEDLAFMNAAHWRAYADHQQLMEFVRRPTWHGVGLLDKDGEPLPMGPGVFLNGPDGSDLQSVGIDQASVDRSLADLKAKEDYMSTYGLQLIVQNTGNVTATAMGIAAAAADSTLKGWVQKLSDFTENSLKKVALWLGESDGPAISINNEFRIPFDATLLSLMSTMVDKGQLSLSTLLDAMKMMGIFGDEFDRLAEMGAISKEQAEKAKLMEFTPSFGSFSGDGNANNNQQTASVAQG